MNHALTATPTRFPLLLTALVLLVGCSDRGPDRVIVSGEVSYQGKPIELGEIKFFPAADTLAPMSGTHIIKGAYRVSAKGGVPVGSHKVEIVAYRDNQSVSEEVEQGGGQQYLPAKYNRQTELTLTIASGSPVVHDFHLD